MNNKLENAKINDRRIEENKKYLASSASSLIIYIVAFS